MVVALAVVGLIRPLLSIFGAYEALGAGAWTPLVVTALIAALWVGAVLITRAPRPLVTLLAAGASYGVLAVILQQVIWNLLPGGAPVGAPSSGPILVMSWVSIVVTNTVWGVLLGLVALGLRRLLPGRGGAGRWARS